MHWRVRVLFQLLPQPENVGVDRACMRIAFVAEYLAEDLAAGDDSSCILHEQFEHLEFVRRESNGLIGECRFHPSEVNPHLPEFRTAGGVRSLCMSSLWSHSKPHPSPALPVSSPTPTPPPPPPPPHPPAPP